MNTNVKEMTANVLSSRSISRLEQQIMIALLGQEDLDEQDRTLIQRVFYGIRHGLLKTVD
ncbi:hypothetical protein PN462_18230 [Spirulina sp. CS-785/01]|uniref:hypothetical protein n=1 Tax=Spirulina sp. CS-785/01 TaxID=3021716 RepID=UPI00232C9D31|nr:hypothetical protein [Spirulina sp. CS-785/01]MDB9315058.1 hypothetical protein [Spirulina sp. CS-785/01]